MSDAWSITDGFWDIGGDWHPTTDVTRAALRDAMGAGGRVEPPEPPPMWFLTAGTEAPLRDPCDLELEDGTTLTGITTLPRDLPLGYHRLQPRDGGPATRLVVAPRRCPLPVRAWGWATQLYALRSNHSWGLGDLRDLRDLAEWSKQLGAGVVVINPLHAAAPTHPQQPSPYSPTSRLWRNINYLRIGDVPGAPALADELAALSATGRSLNDLERIDRDAVHSVKIDALERLFRWFESTNHDVGRFEAWVRRQGDALARFAVWSALAERHGPHWPGWPSALHHPSQPAVAAFAERERGRVRFHQWCQWQLSEQIERAASVGVELVADLAVGFDPAGADAWAFQDLLALDCRVGAPPDTFNPQGQDWGLPPFVPWKLRHAWYQPFIETLRAAFAHGGGIRIDHVMGLFRLYWIPPGAGPADGTYVRYPFPELLDLVALEATRAGAFVVGEDLGTVENEVREELLARDILSYRVLWFEDGPPPSFPRQALASVTTHDLPTMAGVWTGADLSHRRRLGHAAEDEDDSWFRSRIHQATGLGDDASTEEILVATHEALAGAPSLIVVATLDDAVGMVDRPNLPGTIDEWPNWRIPLHRTLEEIEADPLVLSVARALEEGVRGTRDLPSAP